MRPHDTALGRASCILARENKIACTLHWPVLTGTLDVIGRGGLGVRCMVRLWAATGEDCPSSAKVLRQSPPRSLVRGTD